MIKFPTPTTYPLAEEGAEPGVSRNICLGPHPATIAHSWLSELQLRRGESELGCQGGHTSCTSFEASPGELLLVSTAVWTRVAVAVLACNKSGLVSQSIWKIPANREMVCGVQFSIEFAQERSYHNLTKNSSIDTCQLLLRVEHVNHVQSDCLFPPQRDEVWLTPGPGEAWLQNSKLQIFRSSQ